jgi:hypothetical protein
MVARYMIGLGLIWGVTAILIVPLGDWASSLSPATPWLGALISSLLLLALAGYAHRRWRRHMEPHLPKTVGPQHGSV